MLLLPNMYIPLELLDLLSAPCNEHINICTVKLVKKQCPGSTKKGVNIRCLPCGKIKLKRCRPGGILKFGMLLQLRGKKDFDL